MRAIAISLTAIADSFSTTASEHHLSNKTEKKKWNVYGPRTLKDYSLSDPVQFILCIYK